MKETKKATAGIFSVWHTGPQEYRVVNDDTQATCSYHPTLSRAFSSACERNIIEAHERIEAATRAATRV